MCCWLLQIGVWRINIKANHTDLLYTTEKRLPSMTTHGTTAAWYYQHIADRIDFRINVLFSPEVRWTV